jgi:hypothetical protein
VATAAENRLNSHFRRQLFANAAIAASRVGSLPLLHRCDLYRLTFGAQTGRCRGPCQLKTSQQQASQWLEAAAFAGHSLRAGFVTSAVKRGANLIKITDVTGHRSLEMLKTYSRDAEAFVGHAGAGLL